MKNEFFNFVVLISWNITLVGILSDRAAESMETFSICSLSLE